ncbi:Fic family protein [Weeksellaceae bacterium TAE3-ERU29]|nr:Fic family protein [Weeksellaceae bacterium TAE3-ERU29]
MKLEKPPLIKINLEYLQRIWEGEFSDFIDRADERYYYWGDLKYRKDTPFSSTIENWILLKTYRKSQYESIQFGNYKFNYFTSEHFLESLHDFDLKLIDNLKKNPMGITNGMAFFKNSLLEEAVASSQVEGAATTTEVAREMLKSNRSPRNESEQMIFNNLRAIEYINEFKDSEISFKIIIELHQIMTANTSAEKYSGDFRKGDVFVTDHIDGEIAHIPPDWKEVESLMEELCRFINNEDKFIHPIVKASVIHFMVAYIHPFKDGNGRTARALFYWYLIKKGYALIRNISISRVILESRTQYDKAFLKTEYDENDLNYFIHYSIKNLRVAFEKLINYRDKKLEEQKQMSLISNNLIEKGLNTRQADLISYLYFKDKKTVTLNFYSEKYDIVRQTASKDLSELVKLNLIKEDKSTKPFKYNLLNSKSVVKEFLEEDI